jgi:hypothetical protein
VYGKAVRVVGAGSWYTRFFAPSGQENTDVGFRAESTANGSTFANFAYFGNYTSRIDGPGKVFDLANVANMVIENIWAEHQVCLYWGANTDNMTIRNSRARNLFADALNMTNGSTNNLVSNIESRASGDDSFALFNATDQGGGDNTGNAYENLTSILTWRAAGVAVYGGFNNVFRNIYIADTLVYSGITISSLDFGIPMNGFGASPPTRFENISIVRAGGHFWGAQTFPRDLAVLRVEGVPGDPCVRCGHRRSDVLRHHVPDQLRRRPAAEPGHRHGLHEHLDHRGAAQR